MLFIFRGLGRSQEGITSPGAGVVDFCWQLNFGFMGREQQGKGATNVLPSQLSHLSGPDLQFCSLQELLLLFFLMSIHVFKVMLSSGLHFLDLLFLVHISSSSHLLAYHLAVMVSLLLSLVHYIVKDRGL